MLPPEESRSCTQKTHQQRFLGVSGLGARRISGQAKDKSFWNVSGKGGRPKAKRFHGKRTRPNSVVSRIDFLALTLDLNKYGNTKWRCRRMSSDFVMTYALAESQVAFRMLL